MLDLPEGTVMTIDGWCMEYYREQIGGKTPWDAEGKCPDFDAIRQAVLTKLCKRGTKLYDFVLVDEGQDLGENAYQLLSAMAKHVTVCADHKQQIYDNGSQVAAILEWLGVRRQNIALLENYRCCPYVVQLASHLLEDKAERDSYILQTRTIQGERETPLLVLASNAQTEKEKLIDLVRVRVSKGERVAVLLPQTRQAFGYATALRDAGVDVENPKELDFATNRPKIMVYHSAKGLTFDSVILPRIVAKSFDRLSLEKVTRLLFVGITRATRWVGMITTDVDGVKPVKQIMAAATTGCLTVQEQHLTVTAGQPTAHNDTQEGTIMDLL